MHITKGYIKWRIDLLEKWINSFKHLGFRYICPFCGFHSKDLKECGEDSEVNVSQHIVGVGRNSMLEM